MMKFTNRLREALSKIYIGFLMSDVENIRTPGFIIDKMSGDQIELMLRNLFLPERFFIQLENAFVEKFGVDGRTALYSAGKKGGYVYSSMANFTQKSKTSDKDFNNFAWILLEYVGGTYASDVSLDLDIENKVFDATFKNFVVCEKNGKGHIITEGGIAGIWSWLVEDKTIEATQTTCQGRGDKKCALIAQPASQFKEQIPYNVQDLPDIKYTEMYAEFNKVRPTEYTKLTLDEMIQAQVVNYDNGKVLLGEIRHFEIDAHILYILEAECSKLSGGEDILFEVAFNQGKEIMANASSPTLQFIMDYLSALGWGDLIILDIDDGYKVDSNFFPWTQYSDKCRYTVFRGLLSGMVSQVLGKETRFKKYETDMLNS
ncbi:MAG: hypothetical protein KKD39_02815 [Candidatus Altiarchaeota archaeon]|nr:hypothetical protein [Candidatus Altiarchaeota archaeon]